VTFHLRPRFATNDVDLAKLAISHLQLKRLLKVRLIAVGYVLLRLDFHPAPILLGFVLGPRFEENFRRSLLISRGDLMTFIERPISAFFLTICVVLIVAQIYVWLRKPKIVAEEKAIEAQVPRTSYSELAG